MRNIKVRLDNVNERAAKNCFVVKEIKWKEGKELKIAEESTWRGVEGERGRRGRSSHSRWGSWNRLWKLSTTAGSRCTLRTPELPAPKFPFLSLALCLSVYVKLSLYLWKAVGGQAVEQRPFNSCSEVESAFGFAYFRRITPMSLRRRFGFILSFERFSPAGNGTKIKKITEMRDHLFTCPYFVITLYQNLYIYNLIIYYHFYYFLMYHHPSQEIMT